MSDRPAGRRRSEPAGVWGSSAGLSPEEIRAGVVAAFEPPSDLSRLSPRRRLVWRIGDTGRELIDRLVDSRAPDDELEMVAVELERIVARLRRFEHGRRYDNWAEASTAGGSVTGPDAGSAGIVDGPDCDGGPSGHLEFSPVVGRANPLAPPLDLRVDEIEGRPAVVGEVTYGAAYEGPPGHVHGGVVAAAFDEVLGAVQAFTGRPGMTGRLEVSYRAPTPLHQPLRFVAFVDEVEGRKIRTSARLLSGEQLCAEATGLFISVDFARLAQLQDDRNRGSIHSGGRGARCEAGEVGG
jgi:acyl-coenzyme A thioesterase PaaI-like protein